MAQQQFTTYMELVGESTVSFDGVMSRIWKRFERFFLTVGYARAASELARQGYYDESRKLMMELTEIREKTTN